MTRSPLLRLSVAAAIAALAGASAQAREAYQFEPETAAVASNSTATGDMGAPATVAALATPQHFGEATQWLDSRAGASERSAVLAETRQARQKGLINDTGEGGATDRVLAQRETFNQQEHDRIVAEYAAAEEAQQLALAEQRRQEIESESDPMLALLMTDPNQTVVSAYEPTDVAEWRASPTGMPQPTLPADVPTASMAPAPSSELRLDDSTNARAAGTVNQGGSDDAMPDTSATPRAATSDGVDVEQ